MQAITATVQSGKLELSAPLDWPDGTLVEVRPIPAATITTGQPLQTWPAHYFQQLHLQWGDEPFARPAQGNLEERDEW